MDKNDFGETNILDYDLADEVDAIVIAREYLDEYPNLEDAHTALRNSAWMALAERVADRAYRAARRAEAPVPEIVALGMAQTYGFIVRRPDAAKAFFEACDPTPIPKWDDERRDAAAEAMAKACQNIIVAMRRIQRFIDEQSARET